MPGRSEPSRDEPGRADLHAHTSASDGALRADQLVLLACERGLTAVAITDHDTVDGITLGLATAEGDIDVVPGVELSCRIGTDEVHILGLFIDPGHTALRLILAGRQRRRLERAGLIVERLRALSVPVSLDRVQEIAGGGSIGRPHVAQALVEAGAVASVGDAFREYLGTGQQAFVPTAPLNAADGIRAIHDAGGVAVFAHPYLPDDNEIVLLALVDAGIDAVEVVYPSFPTGYSARLRALAERHDLIPSGGSDFHGLVARPERDLGAVTVPIATVEAMRSRATSRYRTAP